MRTESLHVRNTPTNRFLFQVERGISVYAGHQYGTFGQLALVRRSILCESRGLPSYPSCNPLEMLVWAVCRLVLQEHLTLVGVPCNCRRGHDLGSRELRRVNEDT